MIAYDNHVHEDQNNQDLPLLPVIMQSTPRRVLFSLTCRDLMEARVSMGLRPEFSARANGTESSASANARIAYCSIPGLYDCTLDFDAKRINPTGKEK